MDKITLYTNPMSCGRTIRWMLEEIGTPYETVIVAFGPVMKAPAYTAINPMGKVPALRHGDRIITERSAICAYLAHTFPEAGLVPEDRSAFYRWMFFGAGPVDHAMGDAYMGFVIPDDKKGHSGYGSFEDVVRVLTDHLKNSTYFCGETFSAVDVYLGSVIGRGVDFGAFASNETLAAYWGRIKGRPALLRANEIDNALIPKP
jgi:glutathione S-transferase